MYKHLLVPTDGTSLSMKAVHAAVALAERVGARVTALYVMPAPQGFYAEGTAEGHDIVEEAFRLAGEKAAKKALAAAEIEASTARVPFEGVSIGAIEPWKQIIHTASTKRCDLIVMASHGRKGLEAVILGSETSKVLTHSKVPVLVYR